MNALKSVARTQRVKLDRFPVSPDYELKLALRWWDGFMVHYTGVCLIQEFYLGCFFSAIQFIAGQSSCCLLFFYTHITQLISNTTSPMMVGCWTGFVCHRATLDQQWENVGVAEVGYSSNCTTISGYRDCG